MHVFDINCAAGVDVAANDLEGQNVLESVYLCYMILRILSRVVKHGINICLTTLTTTVNEKLGEGIVLAWIAYGLTDPGTTPPWQSSLEYVKRIFLKSKATCASTPSVSVGGPSTWKRNPSSWYGP